MAKLVLVICKNPNIRRFYVENLVVRGYNTIGVPQVTETLDYLTRELRPDLILIWGETDQFERDVVEIRQKVGLPSPIVLICPEPPSLEWMYKWRIAAYLPQLSDSRQLVSLLYPWLHEKTS